MNSFAAKRNSARLAISALLGTIAVLSNSGPAASADPGAPRDLGCAFAVYNNDGTHCFNDQDHQQHTVYIDQVTWVCAAQNAWAAFHYRPNPNDPEVEGRHLTSDGSFPDCQDFRGLPGNTVVTRYTIENW